MTVQEIVSSTELTQRVKASLLFEKRMSRKQVGELLGITNQGVLYNYWVSHRPFLAGMRTTPDPAKYNKLKSFADRMAWIKNKERLGHDMGEYRNKLFNN